MSGLLELADRCEMALGPDRILDAEITVAIDLQAYEGYGARDAVRLGSVGRLAERGEIHQNIWSTALPRYTASLDAAMTLVPEGSWLIVKHVMGPQPLTRDLFIADVLPEGGKDRPVSCNGRPCATSPLALCAAGLRARHHAKSGEA